MFSNPDQDMTLNDTARLLDVPEQAVLRWARKGVLPSRNVQGQTRFRRRDVESWAEQMGMRLKTAGAKPAPEPNALAASIRRGGLVGDLSGETAEQVLRRLVERIDPPEGLAPGALVDLLLQREKLASTAAGDGIALPHPRQPLTGYLDEPRVVVARLAAPVDWGALDQTPVSLLFLVLSCSLKGHLDMLARIAQVIRVPDLRNAVEHETDLETLCCAIEAYPGS